MSRENNGHIANFSHPLTGPHSSHFPQVYSTTTTDGTIPAMLGQHLLELHWPRDIKEEEGNADTDGTGAAVTKSIVTQWPVSVVPVITVIGATRAAPSLHADCFEFFVCGYFVHCVFFFLSRSGCWQYLIRTIIEQGVKYQAFHFSAKSLLFR